MNRPAPTPEMAALRERIDALDAQIEQLLNQRAMAVVEIGKAKRVLGLPVYDAAREAEIFHRLDELNPGPLENVAIRRIYERMLDEYRRLERLHQQLTEIPEASK
jgi:chorismate mutase